MELIRDEEGDLTSNELMQEVWQQFMCYKEKSRKRFQELEELIDLAAQKLSILRSNQAKQQEESFVTLTRGKANVRLDRIVQQPGVTPDALHHLELRLPKFKERAEVFECSQDCEHQLVDSDIGNREKEWLNFTKEPSDIQKKMEVFSDLGKTYTGRPIYDEGPVYDEEPGEGQEFWPEQEFILVALRGDNSNSPGLLQTEICTNIRSEELTEFSNIQDSQQGNNNAPFGSISSQLEDRVNKGLCPYWPEFEDQQKVCQPACLSILTKKAPAKFMVNKPNKVLEDVDKPKLVGCKGDEKQGIVEEESAIILPNMRKGIEDVPCRESPIAAYSSDLGQNSSNLVKKKMIIFDPGGYESTDAVKMVKEMFRHHTKLDEVRLQPGPCFISSCQGAESPKAFDKESKKLSSNKVKIVEDAKIISFGGEDEHLKDNGMDFLKIDKETPQSRTKLILVQIVTSPRIQEHKIQEVTEETGQLVSEINDQYLDSVRAEMIVIPYMCTVLKPSSFENASRLEYLDASKSRVITIFDPGGCIISVCDAPFVGGTAGILYVQQLLQEILNGKELSFKGHGLEIHDPP